MRAVFHYMFPALLRDGELENVLQIGQRAAGHFRGIILNRLVGLSCPLPSS